MSIKDTRMMARAITDRWPLSAEYRTSIIKVLMQIALNPSCSPRERTSAAKALIAADAVNMAQSKIIQENQHHQERLQSEQLDRIANAAQRLGLARVVDAIAQERSGSGPSGNVAESRTANNLEG